MKINLALLLMLLCGCGDRSTRYKLSSSVDTAAIAKQLNGVFHDNLKNHHGRKMLSDARIAVDVAEIYMIKVYGKDKIEGERPYVVSKYKNYWLIVGSIPYYYTKGGTFEILLDERDGQVITFSHGK